MQSKIRIIVFLCLTSLSQLFAQQELHLYGRVRSATQNMNGALVSIAETKQNTLTDSNGYFQLKLHSGNYTLSINALGFATIKKLIKLKNDTRLDFVLESNSQQLNEIVINAQKTERILENTQMGSLSLSAATIKSIPAIFGEQDVVKAIQLLPGIKSAGEGSAGIYVRGGSSDQNLILMDDVPVYNASHLLGFFSAFNPDVVDDITVYKTGMPANYGGRLSSVLAVKMRKGNNQRFAVSGGVGLISSKLSFEGPLKKNKSSFILAARRTYADALLRLSSDTAYNRNILYFYDVNANLNFDVDKKNKLNFSTYLGADKMGMAKAFGLTWGNTALSSQWQHQFQSNLASSTLIAYTKYRNQVDINVATNNIRIYSDIKDWHLKQHFFWQASPNHYTQFGLQSSYHQVVPGEISASASSSYNSFQYQNRYSWENALFLTDDWKISSRLNATLGIRLNSFSVLGGSKYLQLDKLGNILNNNYYTSGKWVKQYWNWEPRIAINYLLNSISSVKLSYVRNSQNMHLISNTSSDRPTDKWLPSSIMITPETSNQYALGYYLDLGAGQYEINVEAYYKTLHNQLDYRDGADLQNADNLETQLLIGQGRAFGIEFLLKKKLGNFSGWLSYTLAKTEKQIPGINYNQWYPARQDRLHEIALVGNYILSDKWTISATWNYYTGNAVTFPEGKYYIAGRTYFYYTQRNGYRMPSYHRLDINALVQLKKKKYFSSELSFGIYNAYARKNAFSIAFRKSEADPNRTETIQTTLFKMLPSISYHFKF